MTPYYPCSALTQATDAAGWTRALADAAARLDFDRVLFAIAAPLRAASEIRLVRSTLPARWERYFEDQCMTGADRAVSHCRASVVPLAWTPKLLAAKDGNGEMAADHGLRSGVVLPAHGPGGLLGMLVLFSARAAANRRAADVHAQMPDLLWLRDSALASSLAFFAPQPETAPPKFSRRELECLRWLVAGKSSWDISRIVEIAETTVNYHIARICRKLGTNSRLVAATKAVRLGLAVPD